ncbi:MAG: hypothetical protein ACK2U9_22835, partial [Anaerolineae bacterium]
MPPGVTPFIFALSRRLWYNHGIARCPGRDDDTTEEERSMETVEERGASFYLGQEYDLAERQRLDQLVHYDARDLTTHA